MDKQSIDLNCVNGLINLQDVIRMQATVKPKPINACVEVTEQKYIKEIIDSINKEPSQKSIERNRICLDMLRRARRG